MLAAFKAASGSARPVHMATGRIARGVPLWATLRCPSYPLGQGMPSNRIWQSARWGRIIYAASLTAGFPVFWPAPCPHSLALICLSGLSFYPVILCESPALPLANRGVKSSSTVLPARSTPVCISGVCSIIPLFTYKGRVVFPFVHLPQDRRVRIYWPAYCKCSGKSRQARVDGGVFCLGAAANTRSCLCKQACLADFLPR